MTKKSNINLLSILKKFNNEFFLSLVMSGTYSRMSPFKLSVLLIVLWSSVHLNMAYTQATNISTGFVYPTIQLAIDAAATADGDTITVAPGIYPEYITINKELTILGPNEGIDPCSAIRLPEAIIFPSIPGGIASAEMILVSVPNVTISGFTIDGDNPLINSGFSSTTGADIDAAVGIAVYDPGVNKLTVIHNIIKNLSYFAINLDEFTLGTPSSGHVITYNKIQDLGTYDVSSGIAKWGGAVLLYDNQYAEVTHNCITNVRIGIQTGNFFLPNPGNIASQNIGENTMSVRRRGIFHNLAYNTADQFFIYSDSITAIADINETVWDGILAASLSVPSYFATNVIDGSGTNNTSEGYEVWNVKLATPAIIQSGSVTGVDIGVFVNNFEGYGSDAPDGAYANINGLSITPKIGGIGVRVLDSPSSSHNLVLAAVQGDCEIIQIGNTGVGVSIENSNANATVSYNDASIHGFAIGINVNGGTSSINNNHIYDNGIGIQFINGGNGNVNTNVFNDVIDNGTDVLVTSTAGSVVATANNWFAGDNFGVNNQSLSVVDATLNYWDDPSGPGAIGGGTGAPVSTLVLYCPWLDAPFPAATNILGAPNGSFTYNLTGGPPNAVSSINNGVQDLSEIATINICDGTNYTLNTVTSSGTRAYIAQTASNGNISGIIASPPPTEIELFDNTVAVLNANIFNGSNYSLSLVNPLLVGTATQKLIFYTDIDSDNNFDPSIDCYGDTITINYIVNPKPALQAEVNNVLVTNNSDGITDTGRITLCDGVLNNVFISSTFQELNGVSEPYVYQSFTTNGTNFVPWCNNCSASVGNFTPPSFATASLINPLIGGTVVLTFLVWDDTSDNQILDADECTGDTLRYIITVLPKPSVVTYLNGVSLNNNNDGITDTARINVCNLTPNNIFISAPFQDLSTATNVKLFQSFTTSGTTFGPWCNNCSGAIGLFVPVNPATASLTNPAITGTVTVSFVPWSDINNDGIIDTNECVGDTLRYIITVNPLPSLQTTINTIQATNNHDNINEIGSFAVCGAIPNNIFFSQFIDQTNSLPIANVKVIQTFNRTNVNFAPADGVFPISVYSVPFFRSVSLVSPLTTGTLIMSFKIFYDADNDNILDADECSNDSIVYTVTVYGQPVIQCPPALNVQCTPDVPANDPATVQIIANPCPGGALNTTFQGDVESARTCTHRFTITRTYRVTNSCCPFVECTQIITVNDTTRPGISCPSDTTVSCSADVPIQDINLVSSSDNCSGTVIISFVSDSAAGKSCPNRYVYHRTYASDDVCGNRATCVQLITVNDTTRPSITCPADLSLICPNEVPPIDPSTVISDDNCAGTVTNSHVSDIKISQTFPSKFILERTYQASDACENTMTCVQTITVNDTVPPTITMPTNITMPLDSLECNRVLCYNVVVNDNCFDTTNTFPGFTYLGSFNGNTYYISNPGIVNHKIWIDANLKAAQLGGHLVTIEDMAENNFLQTKIPFTFGLLDNQYWIGLRYFPSLYNFKWTTGEPFSFTNWGFGQPGIIPGDFVWYFDPTGKWFDSPSSLPRRYVIEFEGGLKNELISGIPSGNPFPPGITTNVYKVTDGGGNMASGSFDVNIIGSTSITCKPVNVSLDATCSTEITARMLLAGEYQCYDIFEVTLSHYGNPVPNPLNGDWVGKTITGKVTDPTTGNSCWSEVRIEDKLAPTIVCINDTMSCFDYVINGRGIQITEECSKYDSTLLGESIVLTPCDTFSIKKIIQTWIATDAYGNVSEPCTREILLRRMRADDINLPTGIIELACDENLILDAEGHPSPSVTGYPTFISNGSIVNIYPFNLLIDCNLLISYEDIDLGEIACVRKIMRSWTVREWYCNSEIVKTVLQQLIIKDNVGPKILHSAYDFEATTSNRSCVANVFLPAIEAVDACHNKLRIDIVYPGGILTNKNGGLVDLPIGQDTIIYRVYDGCYNLTEDTVIITVKDVTEPVAICDRRTVVAINGSGFNQVPAEVFDDGSFDECHVNHFEVRRMDLNPCGIIGEDDWGPEVDFCCEDVGQTIMVGFKVVDDSGNEGICMVTVEVQDKDKPRITCPPSIRIDCRFDIDLTHLGNSFGTVATDESLRDTIVIDPSYWYEIDGHPFDGIAYDNCNPRVFESIDTTGRNQCGLGLIIRKFVVVDNQGNSDSCTQRITIENHHLMTELNITWPLDFEVTNICDPSLLRPELLSDPYKFPSFSDDECSLVGLDYTDHVFSSTIPGEPCFKIFREWKVIDWCYRDEGNNIRIFRDTQIIKVSNTIDPVITKACRDTTICSYSVECKPIEVTLSIAATDFCTNSAELLYRYKIDFNSDGIFDVNHAEIGNPVATGTWPIGKHIIKWEVEDRCGNTTTCQSQLNLLNCKPPTAYAHRDLAIGLTGMDTDGDGIPDTKMAIVWASDLDAGSNHTCGYKLKLSFSSDTSDTRRVYTCDSIGPRNVELWVTDINGNTSFVKTLIIVSDNPQQDPPCPGHATAKVSGLVHSTSNNMIEQVEVNLDNSKLASTMTNYEGAYSFGEMNTGGSYSIRPYLNEEWLNGVSTADIVKIQKHILGKELINSPYLMIAADVNNSKSITSADISELRKLILGITNEVSKNTSWRFVNEYYNFGPLEGVLNESFQESYDIPSLKGDIHGNFIGIKIGDLTDNAKTRGFDKIETRSARIMDLSMLNHDLQKNEVYEIKFNSKNLNEIQGFQMTLEVNPQWAEIIELVGNKTQKFGEDNFNLAHVAEGKITISWNSEFGNPESNIFTLKIRSHVDKNLSELIKVSSSITEALCVDKSGEEGRIQLRTYNEQTNDFIVMQNEPNPWKQSTTIGMILPNKGDVMLTIYDLSGRVFYRSTKSLEKGYNEWQLGRTEILSPGVYYYQVDYDTNTKTNKMVIVE
ncbi:MAG: T9SS type A sorting domain-containing protein [Saprospiraceae bacterium]